MILTQSTAAFFYNTISHLHDKYYKYQPSCTPSSIFQPHLKAHSTDIQQSQCQIVPLNHSPKANIEYNYNTKMQNRTVLTVIPQSTTAIPAQGYWHADDYQYTPHWFSLPCHK